MYLTEKEVFGQYDALALTNELFARRKEDILNFYKDCDCDKIIFIGCGSSFSLAKSAAAAVSVRMQTPAYAYPAGDLLLNFSEYDRFLRGSLLVSISRSGSTSEVEQLICRAKDQYHTPCISICATENSALSALAELNIELPWAFDESVCQTRCVTNLYAASLLMVGIIAEDTVLLDSVSDAIQTGAEFMRSNREGLEKLAQEDWNYAVVLADGELCGIAEEGALAFNEISMLHSHYYHLLDVRHGPIVLFNRQTLVIMALTQGNQELQKKLISDIRQKGAKVVLFGSDEEDIPEADLQIRVKAQEARAAEGIPFIFISQALSLFKAIKNGNNPDLPTGLDPWIKL